MSSDSSNASNELPPGYHEKPSSTWQKMYRSDTGGISPMSIEGLEKYTNHRINYMTPDVRAWRKQWLLDQHLSHREPVYVPEIHYELNNPIRRFIKYPLNQLEKFLTPFLSKSGAECARVCVSYSVRGLVLAYIATYYFMYRSNDWTHFGGINYQLGKPFVCPGSPGYPFVSDKKMDDFYDFGFKESCLYKSEERIRTEYAAELARKEAANN